MDGADGILCAEGEGALIVVVWVLFENGDAVIVCVERGWEKKTMKAQLATLGAAVEEVEACTVREKSCRGGEARRTASLMALDAGKSWSEDRAVC